METLLEKTIMTPQVIWSENSLLLKGNLIICDNPSFWKEISNKLLENSKTKHVEFDLEYVNTDSLRILLRLLIKTNGIKYKWYYQDFDEDMLEMGKSIEEITKSHFEFIKKES